MGLSARAVVQLALLAERVGAIRPSPARTLKP